MGEAGLSVQSDANHLGHVKPRCLHNGRAGATEVAEVLEDLFPP